MSRRTTKYVKAALSAMHYSGASNLLAPLTAGAGAIFMLHQVGPDVPDAFSPNRILKITPTFLEQTINQCRSAGFDLISLDEVAARLAQPDRSGRPFVAFTLDDAYRDNLVHAAPVFRRNGVPFAVYAPTDYIDGNGDLWWLALEKAIARLARVVCEINGDLVDMPCATVAEKDAAYHEIYWRLRKIDETVARTAVGDLCRQAALDLSTLCRDLVLNWDELRELAADPLATIGGHTVRHYALSKLGAKAARHEMAASVARLEAELGRPVRHFSYPFGDVCSAGPREFDVAREMGFLTAVTTIKGLVHARHRTKMTASPRVSLNGDYQDTRYTSTLLSGAPFALRDLAKSLLPARAAA
jgi:peptidoglycan/xylan/chitin deacetylase (PgdA/CDA1 family)